MLGLERARYRLLKIAEDFKAVESTADEPSIRSPRRINRINGILRNLLLAVEEMEDPRCRNASAELSSFFLPSEIR